MNTGRTIEQLIATVERAEQQAFKLPRAIVVPCKVNTYAAVSPWLCEWPRVEQAVYGAA